MVRGVFGGGGGGGSWLPGGFVVLRVGPCVRVWWRVLARVVRNRDLEIFDAF